jgi:hypothetical protein
MVFWAVHISDFHSLPLYSNGRFSQGNHQQ